MLIPTKISDTNKILGVIALKIMLKAGTNTLPIPPF
jgi:hypothetical protein